ncbi:sugar phosphate isomerase/epimerase [Mucilaginibacter sp.]|uniref:sugar phosphate isomerase/epimerase family protein n=1 Tax=Mucilaginibacter sp. TaxID=1882438 RepID=UPI0028497DFC|nr:sugar phosphate isomerase/epimerase [Mucilaginibacter sp.]MDR3695054.1 sugar phosphate isomerase/epimerase [Mucilaginibacter sp.]
MIKLSVIIILVLTVFLFFLCSIDRIQAQNNNKLLPNMPGVVSYTYRAFFEMDVSSTLDMITYVGFNDIELSNLFGRSATEMRILLDKHHIKCSSYGVSYEDLVNKTDKVAHDAQTLGAQYVRVAGIPHNATLSFPEMQKAVYDFNACGKILKEKYGLIFVYHNHGFEFEPYRNGTLYDYLLQQTNPQYVSFELDIFWAVYPGQDPALLLKKYGGRYQLMHLKDLKKGIKGSRSENAKPDDDVILGTGQINIPAVLRAAKQAGIQHYYIEDESNNVIVQVPESIAYLRSLNH